MLLPTSFFPLTGCTTLELSTRRVYGLEFWFEHPCGFAEFTWDIDFAVRHIDLFLAPIALQL
jgi:hypothetical protein